MNTDLKVLKSINLTTAATASASCDTAGCRGLKIFIGSGASTTTTLTASLEISSYDSTSASSGTSLTSLITTTEIAAYTLNTEKVVLIDLHNVDHGRYLYALWTDNGKADSYLLICGCGLEDGAETTTKAGVTTLVTSPA